MNGQGWAVAGRSWRAPSWRSWRSGCCSGTGADRWGPASSRHITRVLGLLATLIWVIGVALLVIGLIAIPSGIDSTLFTRQADGAAVSAIQSSNADGAITLLTVGTILVGVAGVLTAGLVLSGRRR